MISYSHVLRAARKRRVARFVDADSGFGLMEAVVALMLIFGMILVLMRTLDTSAGVLVETRKSAAATTFATELLERAQSLEWEHIGLAASQNGTDCVAGQVGCTTYATEFPELAVDAVNGGYTFDGEAMVFNNSTTYEPFLTFHETVDRGESPFDRYIFVTSVDDDGDGGEDYRRVTVTVTWQADNGFPDRVSHAAIMTPYVRPSQPLIRTDVSFEAGGIDLSGYSEAGAVAAGTRWLDTSPSARDQFLASITLPALETTALSDFVSEARSRVLSSLVPLVRWAGADGTLTTDDDVITKIDPTEVSLFSDDDLFTTPLPQETTAVNFVDGLRLADAWPNDLRFNETAYTGDWETSPITGAVVAWASAVDTAAGGDERPVSRAYFIGVGQTVLGTREYTADSVESAYDGQAIDISETGYDWFLYRRGNASDDRLSVDIVADRTTVSGSERTTGSLSYSSPGIVLLDDGVLGSEEIGFEGWVKVTLPSLSVAANQVISGQGATPLFLPTGSDLVVSTWDPTTSTYTSTTVDYPAFGGDCASAPTAVTVPVGPFSVDLAEADAPHLTYEVEGTVTVNPWCSSSTSDGSIVEEATWETVGPMVSALIDYRVLDNLPVLIDGAADPHVLFDLKLGMTGDTISMRTIYSRSTS